MEAKKKNLVIAGVVAAALSLAAGTVAAQDYFSPLFGAVRRPCGPGQLAVWRDAHPYTSRRRLMKRR